MKYHLGFKKYFHTFDNIEQLKDVQSFLTKNCIDENELFVEIEFDNGFRVSYKEFVQNELREMLDK